jgi:hypothetical protein
MSSHLQAIPDLHQRLLKLERQNLRLKRIGAAALVVAVSLLVMGQASQKRKTVEADEFIVRDDNGNVRVRLSMNENFPNPEMLFLDEKGRVMLELVGGMGRKGPFGGAVLINDGQGRGRGTFQAHDNGALLSLSDVKGYLKAALEPGRLDVSDSDGFEATVGTQGGLVTPGTGETHKTSAASLLLFDKNKKVIWKAP